MKKTTIKMSISLVIMLLLVLIDGTTYFWLIVLIGCYAIFKAMDLYHELKRRKK